MYAEATARFTSVTFDWIPGHAGIHGNERVDKAARTAITPLENWRWDGLCFGIGQLAGCKERLQTAWERWHMEDGRLYYNRKPKNTKHLRGLTRMEFYVLLRLRDGVRGVRHGLCDIDPDERFHLRDCPIYATGRLEKHEIWNNKKISDWVHWMRIHLYLGCGVPMNHPEEDGHRVVAGNPFSMVVRVDDDGRLVVKPTPAGECRRCGYVGTGGHNCLRPMDRLNTRHIYLPGRSGTCAVCGRDFVRLNKHMASSAACAAAWRRLYWDNLIGDWDGVSDSLKVALVVRFGVLESPTSHVCCVCGFKGATGYSLTAHWRIQGGDSCYGILLARLEDKLFGGVDVFGD